MHIGVVQGIAMVAKKVQCDVPASEGSLAIKVKEGGEIKPFLRVG